MTDDTAQKASRLAHDVDQKLSHHERTCGERMARIEKMFEHMNLNVEKLWDAVDAIRSDQRSEGFRVRDTRLAIAGAIIALLLTALGGVVLQMMRQ